MSNKLFTTVPTKSLRTNTFDLSHDRKFSLNFGKLTPIYLQEVIPSDSVSIRDEIFMRFAPLVSPVMHRVNVFTHYFFVPTRILWDGFEDFISGDKSAEDTPAFPYVDIGDWSNTYIKAGSLGDYLGLPLYHEKFPREQYVSAVPFAAYHRIFHEYYRDENLQTPDISSIYDRYDLVDGQNGFDTAFENGAEGCDLFERAWTKDYFTSALPWAQKGDEVMLPLGSVTDVNVYTRSPTGPEVGGSSFRSADGSPVTAGDLQLNPNFSSFAETLDADGDPVFFDAEASRLRAATSELEFEAASINNLRRAFRLQEWLEKNARGGTRYTESIQVHFGIKPQDSRLQRPEYIGGAMQPVTISEVLNTVGTETRPQGDMAGHGVSVGSSKKIRYFAREHGYIIGIMSVMPVPAYQQGIPRHFSKFDRFDYYWSDFAHIGEQEIKNKELVLTTENEPDGTFGYTPRYAEYKFMDSTVHGDFRTSLDFWHMGRIFDPENPPALNSEFIKMKNAEVDRIFAVQDEDVQKLWCHVYHNVRAKRPMPKFGVPSF